VKTYLPLSRRILHRMRNVLDKSFRETQNRFYGQLRFSVSRAVYEIMWKNMAQPDSEIYTSQCVSNISMKMNPRGSKHAAG
jgi:hypothetical protein